MVLLPKHSPRPRDVDFELVKKIGRFVYRPMQRYFRPRVEGLDNVPDGRALLVSVHNGGVLPVDSFVLGSHLYRHFNYERPFHFLAHDILWNASPRGFSDALERIGAVQGNPVNAASVLEADRAMVVYPGGAWEVYRPFSQRHHIDWNGHMGYIRLAVKTRAPIVPVPSVGGHETLFVLTRGEWLGKLFGFDGKIRSVHGIPLAIGFPWGLQLPFPLHLPMPAQLDIKAMEPMELHNTAAGRALFRNHPKGDPELLAELHTMVQQKVQQGMNELAEGRVPLLGRMSGSPLGKLLGKLFG